MRCKGIIAYLDNQICHISEPVDTLALPCAAYILARLATVHARMTLGLFDKTSVQQTL